MTNIKLYVNGAHARAQVFGELVAGTVGIAIDAKFNDEWNDLNKHLVCRNGKVVKTKLDFQNGFTVAPEAMIAGGNLEIGFEGMSQDGNIVFPTVWASCGVVKDGANANDDYSADPTNPVWDQLEKQIGDLSKLETSAKDSIVEAVNEVANKDAKIPVASEETLGGVKAEPVTENDTQPVRIGEDGMLYTAPGGGGGEVWETIIDYTVPEDCISVILKTDINGNSFSLKKAIITMLFYPLSDLSSVGAVAFTTDSNRVNNPYGVNTFKHFNISMPNESGKYSYLRVELVKTPTGVWVREFITGTNAGITDNDIYTGGRQTSCHEDINIETLESYTKDIAAFGIGSYLKAIGAGTKIKMVGVRE